MTFQDWLAAGSAVLLGAMYLRARALNERLRAERRRRAATVMLPPEWVSSELGQRWPR